MKASPIDTNVIVRYLVETPETLPPKFKGVFSFFVKLERGTVTVFLPDLVLFETFFVLTSFYEVPQSTAADTLSRLIGFKGINMSHKPLILACLKRLKNHKIGLVDAYLIELAEREGGGEAYSFDSDLEKAGIRLLPVG